MCSLTGVFGLEELTFEVLYKGAFSQQHRGEDGVGIAGTNGQKIHAEVSLGLVSDHVDDLWEKTTRKLGKVTAAIVHTRYPTEGEVTVNNAQPFLGETKHGAIAYGHNGELTNFRELRQEYLRKGVIFTKSSDSEMFLAAYAETNHDSLEQRLVAAAQKLKGAYNVVGVTEDTLFAIRDQHGFKPLSIAKLNGGYVIASETCAFLDIEGAEWAGDVTPGSVITINKNGLKKTHYGKESKWKPCLFEHIYFARPDSHIAARNVHLVRREMGKQLWEMEPVDADIVVPIEDSGRSAAEGFAEASGIPLRRGYVRSHYVGRTFIRPTNVLRERGVNLKLAAIREVFEGNSAVIIDDSIVEGNTARSRVRLARQAGAKEVHLYITSPKLIGTCPYGIDFHKERMRANKMPNDEEFMRMIDVDSLVHLPLERVVDAVSRVHLDTRAQIAYHPTNFCNGCMTLDYPVPFGE